MPTANKIDSLRIPDEKLKKLGAFDRYFSYSFSSLGSKLYCTTSLASNWKEIDFGNPRDFYHLQLACVACLEYYFNPDSVMIKYCEDYVVTEAPSVSRAQGYGYTSIEALIDLLCEL